MNSVLSAAAWGCFFGVLNGSLCRRLLKKSIDKSDKIFFGIFVGGILYKLFFLAASILLLGHKKDIILIVYSIFLIFFQFVFELKPVKKETAGP